MPEPTDQPLGRTDGNAPADSGPAEAGKEGRNFRALARNVLTAALLAVAVGVVVWYVARPEGDRSAYDVTLTAKASGPAPKLGQEAPDFRLPSLDGTFLQLSDFRGQAVWVNFWATWCPPCRAENPDIEATYLKYKGDGLAIIAVNLGEDPETVRGYVERTDLTFPVGLDFSTAVAATYRLVGIPTHFFIDADGVLREWRIGGLSREAMEEKVQSILPAGTATE